MDDYEAYEAQVQAVQVQNERLLAAFENWLREAGLKPKTVKTHVENVDFFANAYVAEDRGGGGVDPRPANEADESDVFDFLGHWFIRKAMWSSESAIKSNIASLKKFYRFLKEAGHMAPDAADEILEMLSEDRGYFVERMRAYEELDPDSPTWEQDWGAWMLG